MQTLKKITDYIKAEYYIFRLRLYYFKATEAEREQIKNGLEIMRAQKQEIKHYKRVIHKNNFKIFYINYICGFVFSDCGQMFARGRLSQMFILWLRINFNILWARLTGYSVNHKYLKSHFVLYAGVKMASRKTGYSEEILIKPASEVLRGTE